MSLQTKSRNRAANGDCLKTCYPTRAKAEKMRRQRGSGHTASYFHTECGAWHITTSRGNRVAP